MTADAPADCPHMVTRLHCTVVKNIVRHSPMTTLPWVPAELLDVGLHPTERRLLIEQADVVVAVAAQGLPA